MKLYYTHITLSVSVFLIMFRERITLNYQLFIITLEFVISFQEFTSISNDAIFIDLSQKPLRASCLRITALDANIRDVTDVEVQVNGCGKNKPHACTDFNFWWYSVLIIFILFHQDFMNMRPHQKAVAEIAIRAFEEKSV